jgi:plastocyanin
VRTLVATVAMFAIAATAAPAAVKPPTRIQVTGKEYWYSLSGRTFKQGTAIVQLVNFGEIPHDLRLQRVGGGKIYKTKIIDPGAFTDIVVKLLPGKYRLWCSVANHATLGMKATIVVRKG